MPDFLTTDDPWFRPVQVKLGPDGALWIADFYNPIIGHYEFPLTDPHRDHSHGRIWRIVYRRALPASPEAGSAKAAAADEKRPSAQDARPDRERGTAVASLPDLSHLDVSGLMKRFSDPNLVVRTLATNEFVDRIGKSAFDSLSKTARDSLDLPAQLSGDGTKSSRDRSAACAVSALDRLDLQGDGYSLASLCPTDTISLPRTGLIETDLAAIRIYAEPFRKDRRFGSLGELEKELTLRDDSPIRQRALVQAISRVAADDAKKPIAKPAATANREEPKSELKSDGAARCLKPLLVCWDHTPAEDIELIHATRMALRDCLLVPRVYEEAAKLAAINPTAGEHLAEVSLGAPTQAAAEFLVEHLRRTKFTTQRAGEYLRHAALNIAPERIAAVAELLESLDHAPLAQRLSAADGLSQAVRQRGAALPGAAVAWIQRTMIEALGSKDEGIIKRAIEAVREARLDAKVDPLIHLVSDGKLEARLRASALEALANMERARPYLSQMLSSDAPMAIRKRAAELLGQSAGFSESSLALLKALPAAPAELASAIGAALANNDDACDKLLTLIESGKASPSLLRASTVAALIEKRPERLRERASALTKDLPPEDVRLDKVITARAEAYSKAKPGPAHGAQVFQQNCAVCHRFKNVGATVGPQLDGIKTRGIHRLIEDILDPNRNVDPMFRQTIIETTDGQTLAGLNARTEGELLTVTDVTGKSVSVSKDKVKSQTESRLSLMPPAFETVIPPSDFNDLLSYLLEASEK